MSLSGRPGLLGSAVRGGEVVHVPLAVHGRQALHGLAQQRCRRGLVAHVAQQNAQVARTMGIQYTHARTSKLGGRVGSRDKVLTIQSQRCSQILPQGPVHVLRQPLSLSLMSGTTMDLRFVCGQPPCLPPLQVVGVDAYMYTDLGLSAAVGRVDSRRSVRVSREPGAADFRLRACPVSPRPTCLCALKWFRAYFHTASLSVSYMPMPWRPASTAVTIGTTTSSYSSAST